MAWTYSGNPGSSSRDAVRFLVGDTNSRAQKLQDGEIDWLVSQYTNVYKAAGYAARAIAAKFADLVDKSLGDFRLAYSQRQQAYLNMAKTYLNQAAARTAMPYAGGISRSDKMIDQMNTDLEQPTFYRYEFEYTGSALNPLTDPNFSGIQ